MIRKVRAFFLILFFSLMMAPICVRAANAADCLIELPKPPTIDGDLDDWKDIPFIVCGANAPCEATSAAVVWRGWDKNNFYFAAQVFDESLISGGDRIDLYFDLRSSDRLGRYPYEQGVWHIRVLPKTGTGTEPTIQVLDSTGRPNLAKSAEVQYAMHLSKEGWNVEVAVPWHTLETDPRTFTTINSTFSIADADAYGQMPLVLLGTTPPDIRNNPNADPITFETLSLHEIPIYLPGFEIYLAEAVWNGQPMVHLRVCCYDSQHSSATLALSLKGKDRVEQNLPLQASLSGRFQVIDRCFPLSDVRPIKGLVNVTIAVSGSQAVMETLATPIYTERERIEANVPPSQTAVCDPYEMLAAYYKELAIEASAEMSLNKDPAKVRQRQLRSQTDPKYWEAVIDIFTRWSLRARHHDVPAWLLDYHRVWSGQDGTLNAFKVISPSVPEPPAGYPLIIEFPYGDINNERLRTYFDLLALENGTLEHERGEAIYVRLAGRGFVENTGASDLLSDEEYRVALNKCQSRYHIDQTKITFKGHSSGAPNALRYAVEYPGDLSFLDLRGGYFEGDFWKDLSNKKEADLLKCLYSSSPYLEVLRGKHVRLMAGENDTGPVDSSKQLAQVLKATGCETEFIELAGTGHDFAYPILALNNITPARVSVLAGGRPEGRLSGSAVQPDGVLQFGNPWNLSVKVDGSIVACETRNISRVKIDVSQLKGNSLILDSQPIDRAMLQDDLTRLERPTSHEPWRQIPNAVHAAKSWSQPGPSLDIRNKPFKIVYGTKIDQVRAVLQERAEAIVRSCTGLGPFEQSDFHCVVVPDTAVSASDIENNSLWLLGNAEENSLTERFSRDMGIVAIPDGFQIGGQSFRGKLLASVLRPSGRNQYVLLQIATTPGAYRGPPMPGWQYDFTIVDCAKPFSPAIAWGFFDQNWQVQASLQFSRDNP